MDQKIRNENNIEISDIFKINNYEYFIVQEISKNNVNGITRDGIYTVGQQRSDTYRKSEIISFVKSQEWNYEGKFNYKGKNINGEFIQR